MATEKANFCFQPKGSEPTSVFACSDKPSFWISSLDFLLSSLFESPYIPPKNRMFSMSQKKDLMLLNLNPLMSRAGRYALRLTN